MNSSPLLISEHPLQVLPSLAEKIGLNEAIVAQQVHYWLVHNERTDSQQHYHDGRWWTYNSIDDWQSKNFPFWGKNTIRRAFANLESQGIVICGNFNKDRRNQTKWYTLNYDRLNEFWVPPFTQNGQMEMPKMGKSRCPKWVKDLYTETNSTETNSQMAAASQSEGGAKQNEFLREEDQTQKTVDAVRSVLTDFGIKIRQNKTLVEACKGKDLQRATLNAIAVVEKVRTGKVKSPQGMLTIALRESWAPSWEAISRSPFSDDVRRLWVQEKLRAFDLLGILKQNGITGVTFHSDKFEYAFVDGETGSKPYSFDLWPEYTLEQLWGDIATMQEAA